MASTVLQTPTAQPKIRASNNEKIKMLKDLSDDEFRELVSAKAVQCQALASDDPIFLVMESETKCATCFHRAVKCTPSTKGGFCGTCEAAGSSYMCAWTIDWVEGTITAEFSAEKKEFRDRFESIINIDRRHGIPKHPSTQASHQVTRPKPKKTLTPDQAKVLGNKPSVEVSAVSEPEEVYTVQKLRKEIQDNPDRSEKSSSVEIVRNPERVPMTEPPPRRVRAGLSERNKGKSREIETDGPRDVFNVESGVAPTVDQGNLFTESSSKPNVGYSEIRRDSLMKVKIKVLTKELAKRKEEVLALKAQVKNLLEEASQSASAVGPDAPVKVDKESQVSIGQLSRDFDLESNVAALKKRLELSIHGSDDVTHQLRQKELELDAVNHKLEEQQKDVSETTQFITSRYESILKSLDLAKKSYRDREVEVTSLKKNVSILQSQAEVHEEMRANMQNMIDRLMNNENQLLWQVERRKRLDSLVTFNKYSALSKRMIERDQLDDAKIYINMLFDSVVDQMYEMDSGVGLGIGGSQSGGGSSIGSMKRGISAVEDVDSQQAKRTHKM